MTRYTMVLLIVFAVILSSIGAASAQGLGSCGNAAYPRLIAGENGRVTPGLPNVMRAHPWRGLNSPVVGEIPANAIFTVLAGFGPQCGDGMWWQYVSYNGIVGWTPEGSASGGYWTEPVGYTPPQQPPPQTGCTMTSILTSGGQGRVTPGLPNIIRSQPYQGSGSIVVGTIPAGGVFTALAGYAPQCSNGVQWWYVSYNGIVGWTGEGQNGTYWVEPVNNPQPQPGCGATRMLVGGTGRVILGSGVNMFTSATTFSDVITSVPGGATFSVLSGPICADGQNMYQINYQGIIGWVIEGNPGGYVIEPITSTSGCPTFGPSRLVVGGTARVEPGLPNNLRAEPYIGARIITQIPAGHTMSVIGGPQCGNGGAWWQVFYNGRYGWTMEGRGNAHWLEPVF